MAEPEMNDLFMYILDDQGVAVRGESSLQVAKKDKGGMMAGFNSAEYDNYANFFDVTDFDFSLELSDSAKKGSSDAFGPFSDWYSQNNPLKHLDAHYSVKRINGTIGKAVDATSPKFFVSCCDRTTFQEGVLVKRAFTGGRVSQGDSQAQAYLRILMKNIRITEVSWTDGDFVEEKLKFMCQHMEIKYRKQNDQGDLGDQSELLNWTWTAGQK
ncbi:MAG: type VI secretion system tube protein Hcp [Acetobacteraceae bacterium]|jgi:type VI protein secretion system component Hcp